MRVTSALRPLILWGLTMPAAVSAQTEITGIVLSEADSTPISSAVVTLTDSSGIEHAAAVSGLDGRFSIEAHPGWYTILVRRAGFLPFETVRFQVGEDGRPIDLTVLVSSEQVVLQPVTVEGEAQPFAPGPLAEFEYRRRRNLGGVFLTFDDIAAKAPTRATEAFYGVANVRVVKVGHRASVVRMTGRSFFSGIDTTGRMDGAPPCPPALYLDGIPIRSSDEVLNELLGSELYAIEIYRRASETPGEFLDSKAHCGVIVVWTKRFQPSRP